MSLFKSALLQIEAATNYEEMFSKVLGFIDAAKDTPGNSQYNAQYHREVKSCLAWVKQVLKTKARIIWYLRWFRLVVCKGMEDWGGVFPENDLFERYVSEYARQSGLGASEINEACAEFTIGHAYLRNFEHYAAYTFPEIANYDFAFKTPHHVIADLQRIEDENVDKTGKGITKEGIKFIDCGGDWAWWDLQVPYSLAEGKAMGHCGNNSSMMQPDDTVLSLREAFSKGKQTLYAPHVTVILHGNRVIGEIKGKENKKPIPKYYPYVVNLLCNKRIKYVAGGGWLPENNLSLSDLSEEQQNTIREHNLAIFDAPLHLWTLQEEYPGTTVIPNVGLAYAKFDGYRNLLKKVGDYNYEILTRDLKCPPPTIPTSSYVEYVSRVIEELADDDKAITGIGNLLKQNYAEEINVVSKDWKPAFLYDPTRSSHIERVLKAGVAPKFMHTLVDTYELLYRCLRPREGSLQDTWMSLREYRDEKIGFIYPVPSMDDPVEVFEAATPVYLVATLDELLRLKSTQRALICGARDYYSMLPTDHIPVPPEITDAERQYLLDELRSA